MVHKLDRSVDTLRALGHQPMPVLKAIRAKCLDCSGGSRSEVADCLVRDCALYAFRLGINPWRLPVSERRREAARKAAARLRNAGTIPAPSETSERPDTPLPDLGTTRS